MHEEGRTPAERRRSTKIDILIDSGDDEPIGLLLKPPKHRNHKKVVDGEIVSSIQPMSNSMAIELHVDDDHLGGMDDTLACFRKRLKGPKKSNNPTEFSEHNSLVNFMGSSPQKPIDPVVKCDFDSIKNSELVAESYVMISHQQEITKDKNSKSREKKRRKISMKEKICHTECDVAVGSSFLNQMAGKNEIDSCIDEDFDDLLSSFVKKTQTQLIRSRQGIASTLCCEPRHMPIAVKTPGPVSPLKKFRRKKRSKPVEQPKPNNSIECSTIERGAAFMNDISGFSNLREVSIMQDFSSPDDICEELTSVTVFSDRIVTCSEDIVDQTVNCGQVQKKLHSQSADTSPQEIMSEQRPFILDIITQGEEGGIPSVIPNETLPSLKPMEERMQFPVIFTETTSVSMKQEEEGGVFPLIHNEIIPLYSKIDDRLKLCSTDNQNCVGETATLNSLQESMQNEKEHKKEDEASAIELDSFFIQERKSLSWEGNTEEFNKDFIDFSPIYHSSGDHKSNFTVVNDDSNAIGMDVRFEPSSLEIGGNGTTFSAGVLAQYSSSDSQLEGPSDRTVEAGMTAAGDSSNNCSTANNLSGPSVKETELPSAQDDELMEISNSKSDSTIPSTNSCHFVISYKKNSSPVVHDKSSVKIADHNAVQEDTIESVLRTPDQSGYFSENPPSVSEPEMKKHRGMKRASRKITKRQRGYSVSEENGCRNGDVVDCFFKDRPASGGTIRMKLDCCSDATTEAEDDGVPAVMAGLKTRAATPIEKIIFKDVFRRKGGLQEYLELRNQILDLWSKNVCRVLLPVDCGFTNIPSENEPSSFTLFRDIYKFLDQRGYINTGIASNKTDAPQPVAENLDFQSPDKNKKRVVVVGAGPAGLAAARHLQRQGFSVTVVEGRRRIGGRVFTDRTSLSVPVDLGASIITGVEADVASERRPDPSAVICRQLGLDLTVLNSDCPLYDTVSGRRVPADLDEALEAEYNSLLDDMVLLVAHEGERAMRMSLEDGLDFVLKRRRLFQSGKPDCPPHDFTGCGKDAGGRLLEPEGDILSPLERRVMDWHFAHLEYGCAALLRDVSLPCWNQDDAYGGFGGAHCMIKGGYDAVVESVGDGLDIRMGHTVASIHTDGEVRVSTSDGVDFYGDAVLVTVPLGCLKAETITFRPPLPEWKKAAVRRLGFGVLNKVALEFREVFWDRSVDYFGATSEETAERGLCFMFWNVEKTVGAPVLISLVVGKAAVEGETRMAGSDYVDHAVSVLRKLFGGDSVPDPVGSVVTDWGRDPFCYGAYSYVAVGATGEDYDLLARPVENRVFFAGEATCKEYPDTVGGAMLSGVREAFRIADVLVTGKDHIVEVEAMEAAQRLSENRRNEVGDIIKRLDSVELSTVDGSRIVTREALLEDMFYSAKTTAGRLRLAKEMLRLPPDSLKEFAGNRKGLGVLNSWILDSMGKDGTQLLRHCVRILVLVSTNLVAVRLSGIGKTVKETVCVHSSRDIRAVASQLVGVWVEVFRKEKAALKSLRKAPAKDSSKCKPAKEAPALTVGRGGGIPPAVEMGSLPEPSPNRPVAIPAKVDISPELKLVVDSPPPAQGWDFNTGSKAGGCVSEEERTLVAVEESTRATAAAELPKIPSFHKFARREQYAQMEEVEERRKGGAGMGSARQDCMSEIDSRNCRVRNWSVDFTGTCVDLDGGEQSRRLGGDGREYSSESTVPVDSSVFTRAWVDTDGSVKDYHSIERWQCQAAAPGSDSTAASERPFLPAVKGDPAANESIISHITTDRGPAHDPYGGPARGTDHMKQAVVDYVASLLMPLYKARKVDKDGYKSIMKKTATKVMELATDAEKSMPIYMFLDSKRKNKIRDFVDKLIERHLESTPSLLNPNAAEAKILST